MSIHTIIYTSKATNDLAGEAIAEIEAILATARRRNADCGIRGALLFTEGRFVQVLEGDKDIVERTFERISSDPRHHDIEVLCRQSASKPRFEYWSMAFVGGGGREALTPRCQSWWLPAQLPPRPAAVFSIPICLR